MLQHVLISTSECRVLTCLGKRAEYQVKPFESSGSSPCNQHCPRNDVSQYIDIFLSSNTTIATSWLFKSIYLFPPTKQRFSLIFATWTHAHHGKKIPHLLANPCRSVLSCLFRMPLFLPSFVQPEGNFARTLHVLVVLTCCS